MPAARAEMQGLTRSQNSLHTKEIAMKYHRSYNNVPVILRLFGIFLLITILIYSLAYLSGEWLPNYNLRIVSLGICQNKGELYIESALPQNTNLGYICGQAEGTSWMKVSFYIFYENSVVLSLEQKIEPGKFYINLPQNDDMLNKLSSGKYRLEARSGRLIIAQTEFDLYEN